MRILRTLGAVAVLAAVVVTVSGPAASADPTGGGFGAAPAHPDPNQPTSRAYFQAVLTPGQTYRDEVVVTSTSDTPLSLLVSPVDGLTGQTSGAVYANREAPVKKAGTWLTPSISALSLAPHSQALVPFRVTVPTDATPGDHLAGLAIENADPQQASGGQFAVTEVFRTVIGVEITVPGPAQPQVHLGTLALKALPGTGVATLTIGLGDNGRKLVKPMLAVSLRGPDRYRRSVRRQLDTILPGDTIHYPFIWPDSLPAGRYQATVRATGGVAPVTRQATLQLGTPLRGATNPNLPAGSPRPWWEILAGVTIGLLLVVWLVTWRAAVRRRRRRARIESDASHLHPAATAVARTPLAPGPRPAPAPPVLDLRRDEPPTLERDLEPVRWRAGAPSR